MTSDRTGYAYECGHAIVKLNDGSCAKLLSSLAIRSAMDESDS